MAARPAGLVPGTVVAGPAGLVPSTVVAGPAGLVSGTIAEAYGGSVGICCFVARGFGPAAETWTVAWGQNHPRTGTERARHRGLSK